MLELELRTVDALTIMSWLWYSFSESQNKEIIYFPRKINQKNKYHNNNRGTVHTVLYGNMRIVLSNIWNDDLQFVTTKIDSGNGLICVPILYQYELQE